MNTISFFKEIVKCKIDKINKFNTKQAHLFVDTALEELQNALVEWEYKKSNTHYENIVIYQFFRHDDDNIDLNESVLHHQYLDIHKDNDGVINIARNNDNGKRYYIITYSKDLPDSEISINEIFSNKGIEVIIEDFDNDDIIYNEDDLKEYDRFKHLKDHGRLIELTFPFKQFLP